MQVNDLPLVDTDRIDDLCETLSPAMAVRLIDLFTEDMPIRIIGIANILHDDDLDNTRKICHAIAGGAASVGAARLEQFARDQMHGDTHAELPEMLRSLYNDTARQFELIRPHLQA